MGFTYGVGKGVYDNGIFKNKTAFLTLTTGGSEIAYGDSEKNGNLETILYPIQHGMLHFVGITVLPPFICFSPARITDEERKIQLESYRIYLANTGSVTPVHKTSRN